MGNPADKTEKSPLPVVAIDGVKIKAIREIKKLTQLYVASVVGVTTDTISRWENNRYPTIKRDNAERLASALEVELAEILRQEDAEPAEEKPSPSPRNRRRSIIIGVALAVLIAVGLLLFYRQRTAVSLVERKLPRFGAPGEVIPVQLRIHRNASSGTGLIIKERLPAGWRIVSSLPPAATGPAGADELKWLVPSGAG